MLLLTFLYTSSAHSSWTIPGGRLILSKLLRETAYLVLQGKSEEFFSLPIPVLNKPCGGRKSFQVCSVSSPSIDSACPQTGSKSETAPAAPAWFQGSTPAHGSQHPQDGAWESTDLTSTQVISALGDASFTVREFLMLGSLVVKVWGKCTRD